MRFRFLIFIFLVFTSFSVFTQNQEKLNVLLKKVSVAKDDTNKVNNLIAISIEFSSIDPSQAIDYLRKSLVIAQRIKFPKGEAGAYSLIGTNFKNMAQYDSAVFYQLKAFNIYKKFIDKTGMSRVFNNIGIVYKEKGDYNEALRFYFKSISFLDEKEHAKHLSRGLMNIGIVYRQMKLFDKALSYYRKSLEIDLKIKNAGGLSRVYANMGTIFLESKKYDSAMWYYNKSHVILDSMKETSTLALVEQNMANIFFIKGNYQKSKELYENSMEVFRRAQDVNSLARGLTSLGAVYVELNNKSGTIKVCEEAMLLAKNTKSKVIKRDTYKAIADNYFKLGKVKEAYELLQQHLLIKDSIYNDDNAKLVNEMDQKYQTEKKEKEIELLHKSESIKNLELKRQNIFIYSGVLLTFIIIIFSFFIYRSLRVNKKSNKILLLQNKEIQEQKGIIEEKNKDIVDSIRYAEGLQSTILPGEEMFKRIFRDSFVLFKPKDIVSGDFYWIEEIKEINCVAFAVIDCTGHGVPGAMMSIVSHNLLTNIFKEKKIYSPADALNELLNDLTDTLSRSGNNYTANDGMDLSLCVWDKSKECLHFSGAFNPLILIRNGAFHEFKANKFSIGRHSKEQGAVFIQHTIKLQKNDMIYLSTDGYADQFGGDKSKKMMRKNFHLMLTGLADKPCSNQCETLLNNFNSWKNTLEQVDDVCVMGLRF
jgi:tetratricopeptide (TPR) repeat protein